MKIIKNKKLFGKINILDIIILFAILAIVVFVICFFGKSNIITNTEFKKMKYDVEIKDLPKDTNEKIKIGDKIYDNEINKFIGEVVSVFPKENTKVKENYETNEFIETSNPEKENIYIQIEVELKETESDFKTSNDYIIKVGKPIVLRGSNFAGEGYIMRIER